MTQHLGSKSRLIWYEETAYDSDAGITNGYYVPLSGVESLDSRQDLIPAPIFKGDRQPFGSVYGMIQNAGDVPIGLEQTFFGRVLKVFTGSATTPVQWGLASGLYNHYFALASNVPISAQIQKEFQDGSALFVRQRGIRVDKIRLSFAAAGVAGATLSLLGLGDELYTDLAQTKNDDGYFGRSYFNGYIGKNTAPASGTATAAAITRLAGVTNFDMTLMNEMSRQDVAFNQGLAGAVNAGIYGCQGTLGLMFEDLSYYNEAINQNLRTLEMVWTDKPVGQETQWLRIIHPQTRFSRTAPKTGGKPGITLDQKFSVENADSTAAGLNAWFPEVINGTLGPFNIDATHFNLGVKVDGGATTTIALTQGAARTAAQIVTDILANATFTTAAGGAADTFPSAAAIAAAPGRFRMYTNARGVGHSIQIDTTVANSCHTVVGLDGTVRTGKAPSASHIFLSNATSAAY